MRNREKEYKKGEEDTRYDNRNDKSKNEIRKEQEVKDKGLQLQ